MTKEKSLFTRIAPIGKRLPILLSSPHSGTAFPPECKSQFKQRFLDRPEDTDWYIDRLYEFAPEMGITFVHARYSRYVIDLNRDSENRALYSDRRQETGLVPLRSFGGESLYRSVPPDETEMKYRRNQFYWPYYRQLEKDLKELRSEFDHVLLFDAHSIRHSIPSIRSEAFPDLILGNQDGKTSATVIFEAAHSVLNGSGLGLQVTKNDPFKGGNITRYFGKPNAGIHSIQLEMCQNVYMDEDRGSYLSEKAESVQTVLIEMFKKIATVIGELK